MKILVFSDSHLIKKRMYKVIEDQAKDVQYIFHLGDNHEDLTELKDELQHITFVEVMGNCDFRNDVSDVEIITIEGIKIMLTHGHKYNVKSDYQQIFYAAKEADVQVCLFGHTHVATLFKEDGIVFMNPGSINFPREDKRPSYGCIEITAEGEVIPQFFYV